VEQINADLFPSNLVPKEYEINFDARLALIEEAFVSAPNKLPSWIFRRAHASSRSIS
jgi:hypothetical protein